jgi:GTP-binding protein HflX
MNALTAAGMFVEDKLFATLDTRTRKWTLNGGSDVLLSDTVGFVKHLPHQLVASFKATLEEAVNADLLLHVVDASNADVFEQITSVDSVLNEIGCGAKEKLVILNKVDALSKAALLESLQTVYPEAICISAKTGMNLDKLAGAVLTKFRGGEVLVQVNCSAGNGKVQSFLRANAKILEREYLDSSVTIKARLGKNQLPLLKRLQPRNLEVVES